MAAGRQSGSAIILALLVVAIIAALASSILWRQETWIADLGMQRERTALRTMVRNGADWARAILAADARTSAIDHPGEPWASRVAPMQLEEGELGGFLEDEQGKWNLNNLVRNGMADPRQFEILQRLLDTLGLPAELAFSLRDWVDADGDPDSAGGAEDSFYLSLAVPFRAANSPLAYLDELRLVRGFTPEVIARLRPFVTALPETTAVNVNTASREVLASVLRGSSDGDIDALLGRRDRLPYRDLADFRGTLKPSAIIWDEQNLTTGSRYFMASISARQGESSTDLTCLIRRQSGRTEIVWQRYQ